MSCRPVMLSARTSKVLKPWATSKGAAAGVRLRRFVDFLDSHNPNDNEFTKPKRINDYINQMPFIDDRTHWKKEDYWASSAEKLATNGGDCEDFSVAKY